MSICRHTHTTCSRFSVSEQDARASTVRRRLAISGGVRRFPGLLHVDKVTPRVRTGAIEVRHAIHLCQPAAPQRLPVPPRPIGVRGKGGDRAPDEPRRFGDDEMRTFAVASRQVSSLTPNASGIISERSQPGVTATDVAPWGARSLACAHARPMMAVLARS